MERGGRQEGRKERRRTSDRKEQGLHQEEEVRMEVKASRGNVLNNFIGIQQQYVFSGAAQRVGQR